jgi:hypothetical protein
MVFHADLLLLIISSGTAWSAADEPRWVPGGGTAETRKRGDPTSPLSLLASVSERSSQSGVRYVAQNGRSLDRARQFWEAPNIKETERNGNSASRTRPEAFGVKIFRHGGMGNFQPALTTADFGIYFPHVIKTFRGMRATAASTASVLPNVLLPFTHA